MSRERVVVVPLGVSHDEVDAILRRSEERGFPTAPGSAPPEATVRTAGGSYFRTPEGIGRRVPGGEDVRIPVDLVASPDDLGAALGRAVGRGISLVRWTGDRVIPLESAVAARRGASEVWVITDRIREVPAALGALERGADVVFVEVRRPEQIDELESLVEPLGTDTPPLVAARVDSVEPGGMGDRVLVDFTSLLAPAEGMLVGSAAGFLFHVASEAEGSAFSRPRPFRVNAGAAHSYSLMADGSTRYLSELEGGDRVWVGDPGGRSRTVRVGRVKVERRPMVLVRATALGRTRTLFVQEAETVRLSTPDGRVSVTGLRAGTSVLGHPLPPGRHLGAVVDETVDER